MPSSKPRILQIGPDPARSQGGMASVIGNILADEALGARYDMVLYPSFHDGGKVPRTIYSEGRLRRFSPEAAPADV